MNREEWLSKAVELIRNNHFRNMGYTIPVVKVSVGFCSKKRAIGQYFHAEAASDGIPQIFIHPKIGDGVKALDVLCHELVHAVTPGNGHGKLFNKAAKAVGLTEGKGTKASAGAGLKVILERYMAELGTYPQAALNLGQGIKAPKTLFKAVCSECDYFVYVPLKSYRDGLHPNCHCGANYMQFEE